MAKVSLLLPSFCRPKLLELGLYSITKNPTVHDLEVLVLNDGVIDETESICKKFPSLNIKYIFTGQRNKKGIIKRPPSFAFNVGLKQCTGDIVILSCPEIYHLNNAVDRQVDSLIVNPTTMVIPDCVYFDKSQITTSSLIGYREASVNVDTLVGGAHGKCHTEMPFFMAIYKKYLFDINGWDESMLGFAGEDNSLILRLKRLGLTYFRTTSEVVHLWHDGSTDGACHFDNPAWVYNWNILQSQVNDPTVIKVNIDKEWGKLEY